jgi:chromosome segregation ATPase
MSDTPRTDAQAPWIESPGLDFARQLERELAAVRHERDEWKAKYVQQNKDLGCEMMDPNGTIWEHAAKIQQQRDRLERELADLKESITSLSHPNCRDLLRERDEAREQRDRLADELADWHNAAKHVDACHPDEAHCGCVTILRKQITDALTQRDRLAEALSMAYCEMRHRANCNSQTAETCTETCTCGLVYTAAVVREALAAVKGGAP